MPEEVIRREFPAELVPSGDGRTLDLRIVPYNVKARVKDPGRDAYDEEWLPGVFDGQTKAPNRVDVLVNFEHEPGIGGVVGRGQELRETSNAAEGTFRMLSSQDADKVLELVNAGVVTGVSLEAVPLLSQVIDGVVQRVKARLINVALCRSPAFEGAQVMAVRESPPDDEPEPDVPPPAPEPSEPSEAAQALARVGYAPLQTRAVVRKPWSDNQARFTDDEYQRSCLIDRGGDVSAKLRCSLPVLEPDGTLNVNALAPAAGVLMGLRGGLPRATLQDKAAAARKLLRMYGLTDVDPPTGLRQIASK